jgi:Zn finger protein HypA/HybF involved in hydrogenase expression
MPKKLSQDEVIEKFKEAHGDGTYDYSLVEYKSSKLKVKIICKKHKGVFEQAPVAHYNGHRCVVCYGTLLKNTESFVVSARKVHGYEFDYGESNYKGSTEKVIITCSKGHRFSQTAAVHLSGSGCKVCNFAGNSPPMMTQEEFISRSKKIHKGKYNYSSVVYLGSALNVEILCDCGHTFHQSATNHLQGAGCVKCRDKKTSETSRLTQKEFIDRCTSVHGDKYKYNKTKYRLSTEKVTITCREHGDFRQNAKNHYSSGAGCPSCASHGFDGNKDGYLYLIHSLCGKYMKIGITRDIGSRQKSITRDTPFGIVLVDSIKMGGYEAMDLEKTLHKLFTPAGFSGFDGYTEWFKRDLDDLKALFVL